MKSLINWKKNIPIIEELDRAISEFYNIAQTKLPYSHDIERLIINPSVDIVEDEESFKVEVEMPGVGEEDVSVSIHDRILTIRAKKKISRKDEGKKHIFREIGYGIYERNVPLPDYVDTDNAKATFKKGMLWVTFPKKAGVVKHGQEIKVEKAAA